MIDKVGSVHTIPEGVINAGLFLRLGLPSTLNSLHTETLLKQEEVDNTSFAF